MNKLFNTVQMSRAPKNTFDLSHDVKMSLKMGKLYPFMVQETLPGDYFKSQSAQLMRMAPMLAPIMHRVDVFTHYFFVPYRILWNQWEDFISGGESGLESPVFPTVAFTSAIDEYSVGSYMGVPIQLADPDTNISAMPLAAYFKIYDDYYRDENLQSEIFQELVEGNNTHYEGKYGDTPLNRAWEHDYFTSALPFAQKGLAVELPLQGFADIDYINGDGQATFVRDPATGDLETTVGNLAGGALGYVNRAGEPVSLDNSSHLRVDLSTASAATITDLRRAFAVQSWLERNAVAGSRYVEYLMSHWGVRSSDSRLQRAEYLGGGKSPLTISEVLQTSATQDDSQLGLQAGHGLNVGKSHAFNRYIEEHGLIIGIMSVMPKTAYMQGIPRLFKKYDKFDYADPTFANIGEQQIFNYEIFWQGDDNVDFDTFGYIPRYSEYKFAHNRVAGEMRTNLDYWHMARKFATPPLLNSSFIEADPTNRIFPVTDGTVDTLYCQIMISQWVTRALPFYGTPQIQ